MLARWQQLKAGGAGWQERYRKFVRIEISSPTATPAQLKALRQPEGLALEIVPVADATLRVGDEARFRVLSSHAPVAGLAVELLGDRSPVGLWSRTDANGEVRWTLPFGGNWLVRTIAIDPDGTDRWRSRFATFAFDAR